MKTNQELLDEANKIDFKIRSNGALEGRSHSLQERGLYFIKNALLVHGIDKYQYGLVQYVDNSTKVEILCPEHGPFFQKPLNHTLGHGCPKCSSVHQYDTNEWVTLAKKLRGDIYNYSKVIYVDARTKVEIVCPIHGSFWQMPTDHTSSFHGCPKCKGKNHNILYLLRCNDTGWYKIGITTTNTKARIKQISGNTEEILHIICEDPREHESYLHKLYEKEREYNPCVKSGNTEFFSLNEEQVKQIIDYIASIAINQKSI